MPAAGGAPQEGSAVAGFMAGQVRSTCWPDGRSSSSGMESWRRRGAVMALPRKEVIQPQLPLRLPCYDFTPVTSPTLGGCLPCGLGHRLQVLLTPMA